MMDKQKIQYIVLGVLLVGLLGAVYFMLKPTTPTAPSKPSQPAASNVTTSTTVASPKGLLDWANPDNAKFAATIIRDPFVDPFAKPAAVASETPGGSTTLPGGNGFISGPGAGSLPPINEVEMMTSKPRKLNWIDMVAATKALENFKTVSITAPKGLIILKGPTPDVEKALETLDALDVEPPVPDFGLRGVIIADERPMAIGLFNGTVYHVVKGQAIPGSGWSVTSISEKSMTVTDGKRTKQITAGGSK